MQVALLPKKTYAEIERLQRDFIWGQRKYHSIGWDQITLPKAYGGLGFKKISSANRACGAKIAWKLLKGDKGLWADVLSSKYMLKNDENLFMAQPGDSNLWRFISKQQEILERGTRWQIRNGRSVSFFTDYWLFKDKKIKDFCLRPLSIDEDESVVADWAEDGAWCFSRLEGIVEQEVIQKLITVMPPMQGAGEDFIIWNATPDGNYTVKSAYYLLEENPPHLYNKLFKSIWKWRGAERIRIFLWQLVHDRLPTNSWRSNWSTSPSVCSYCLSDTENILHVVRDCSYAKLLWLHLIDSKFMVQFFNSSLRDWIHLNLTQELRQNNNGDWDLVWGVSVWKLWIWRNKFVFDANFDKPLNPAMSILHTWRNYVFEEVKEHLEETSSRNDPKGVWQPPTSNFVLLNVDGARSNTMNIAGCGGYLRNSSGEWLTGFCHKIGPCSVLEAEQWAIFKGLSLAWDYGVRKLIVHSDAKILVDMLNNQIQPNKCSLLMLMIHRLLQRPWEVRLQFIPRNSNVVADSLAKRGIGESVLLASCPENLISRVECDRLGILSP